MRAYSDPKREDEPAALPGIKVWQRSKDCCPGSGWYWRSCFPGCLPDSDPVGPFETEAEALADAREMG